MKEGETGSRANRSKAAFLTNCLPLLQSRTSANTFGSHDWFVCAGSSESSENSHHDVVRFQSSCLLWSELRTQPKRDSLLVEQIVADCMQELKTVVEHVRTENFYDEVEITGSTHCDEDGRSRRSAYGSLRKLTYIDICSHLLQVKHLTKLLSTRSDHPVRAMNVVLEEFASKTGKTSQTDDK
eukprot:768650-Hanusia_phi.AAC.15